MAPDPKKPALQLPLEEEREFEEEDFDPEDLEMEEKLALDQMTGLKDLRKKEESVAPAVLLAAATFVSFLSDGGNGEGGEDQEAGNDGDEKRTPGTDKPKRPEPGDLVRYDGRYGSVVKTGEDGKTIIYQPSKIPWPPPTGFPKPEDMEKYEKLDVRDLEGKPFTDREYYRHKESGRFIMISAEMQFPAAEIVMTDAAGVQRVEPDTSVTRRTGVRERPIEVPAGDRRDPDKVDKTTGEVRVYGDGVEITVPIKPDAKSETNPQRDVRFFSADGGKTNVMLTRDGIWFHIAKSGGATEGDVKAHISITNSGDKAHLDRLLIPLISDAINGVPGSEAERLGLTKLLTSAKLRDPLYREDAFQEPGVGDNLKYKSRNGEREMGVSTEGQASKGFTVYGRSAADIEKAAEIIDKWLAEKAEATPQLVLSKDVRTGNISDDTKLPGANRISISRETWPLAVTQDGRNGAAIEQDLGQQIRQRYGQGGNVTQQDLDRLARDVGIEPGLITLDAKGKLMVLGTKADRWLPGRGEGGDAMYMTEAGSETSTGRLNGRPAMYALYRHLNVDTPELKDPARYVANEERLAQRFYMEQAPAGFKEGTPEHKALLDFRRAAASGDIAQINKAVEAIAKLEYSAGTKVLDRLKKEYADMYVRFEHSRTYGTNPTIEIKMGSQWSPDRNLVLSNTKPAEVQKRGVALPAENAPETDAARLAESIRARVRYPSDTAAFEAFRKRVMPAQPAGREEASDSSEGEKETGKPAKLKPAGPPGEADRLADLIEKGDAKGIVEFARTTKDVSLAQDAVSELIELAPENVREMLIDLAKSDSNAVGPAMKRLMLDSDEPGDKKLVEERWKNGDLLKLWKEGKIDARDILYALDYVKLSDTAAKEALEALKDHPDLRRDLCRAIVEKDFMNQFEIDGIGEETRIKAAEHLLSINDPKAETILRNLSIDKKNAKLAEWAGQQLERIWTAEAKPEKGKPSKSELVNGTRLKKFIDELGSRGWNDIKDAPELYKKWKDADKKFYDGKTRLLSDISYELGGDMEFEKIQEKFDFNWDNDKIMEENLKDKPKLLERYRAARAEEAQLTAQREQVEKVVRGREAAIRPYLERYCAELGIPVPEFQLLERFERDSYNGVYRPGRGKVQLLESLAMSGEHPSPEFLNTLFHELTHVEQDALIMRRLADKLKIGEHADAAQREALRRAYVVETSGNTVPTDQKTLERTIQQSITDSWMDKVLEKRGGKELSESEALRAEGLIKGKREKAEFQAEQEQLRESIEKLSRRRNRIRPETPLVIMLGNEPDRYEEKLKSQLEVQELSPALKDALNKLIEAQKRNAPFSEIEPLEQTLKTRFKDAFTWRLAHLEGQHRRNYRDREHEVESHEVGKRAGFFGLRLDSRLKASGEPLTPIGTGEIKPGLPAEQIEQPGREEALKKAREASLAPHEVAAVNALDETLREAAANAKEKVQGEGGVFKFKEPLKFKFKDKVLDVSSIEVIDGKIYFKSEKDGMRYKAEPWLAVIGEGLQDRAALPGEAGQQARDTLALLKGSTEARVSLLKAMATNFARYSEGLAVEGGGEAAPPRIVKGRPPGQTGGPSGPVIATGGGDIRSGQGGGFDVTGEGSRPKHGAPVDDLKKEEIEALREKILKDREGIYTAEDRARALKVLELAEKGDAGARAKVAKSMKEMRAREGGAGGIADRAAGAGVGLGLIVLTLGGWYAYNQLQGATEPYVAKANVN